MNREIEKLIETWKTILSETNNIVSETYIETFLKDLEWLLEVDEPKECSNCRNIVLRCWEYTCNECGVTKRFEDKPIEKIIKKNLWGCTQITYWDWTCIVGNHLVDDVVEVLLSNKE